MKIKFRKREDKKLHLNLKGKDSSREADKKASKEKENKEKKKYLEEKEKRKKEVQKEEIIKEKAKEYHSSKEKPDEKNIRHSYSWKAFLPFTKEAKRMRAKKTKESKEKTKKKFSLAPHLHKAGYELADEKNVKKILFRITVGISLFLSFLVLLSAIKAKKGAATLLVFMAGYWTFVFLFLIMLVNLIFVIFLDLRAYNRTKEVEAVLADFLQLASANISAGMPLDRALWYAVRPQFGILAKEIERVAKATYAGKELKESLTDFANRFDSKVLKRSVSLILEGMSAGGEMAELLTKIALNIEETNIMKKEMSANVTTYVIFIGFATVLGAPFLFGLATQLLIMIKTIAGNLVGETSSSSMFAFSINANAVKLSDFKLYCILMLMVSSFFSGAIISVIRKGNIKEGAVLIPSFIVATILLYYLANLALGILMGAFV